MSSTNRNTEDHPRIKDDVYETPKYTVYRILDELNMDLIKLGVGNNWLEPSAGSGAIINAVQNIVAIKILRITSPFIGFFAN